MSQNSFEDAGFWIHLPIKQLYESESEFAYECVVQCMNCKKLVGQRLMNTKWRKEGNHDVRTPILNEREIERDMALLAYKNHMQPWVDQMGHRHPPRCSRKIALVGRA